MKISLLILMSVLTRILNSTKLIDEAASVANKLYTFHQLTSVVWYHQSTRTFVDNFLEQYNGTVITIDINRTSFKDTSFHKIVRYHQTVFFADDPNEFQYFLECINTVVVVPIQVIMILTQSDINHVEAITKIAWEKDVSDILILSNDDTGNVQLSTYKPFSDKACDDYKPIYLNTNTEITFIRKYRNFHKCPVRITLLEFMPFAKFIKVNNTITGIGGTDGHMIMLTLERLNASMHGISYEDLGDLGINGTERGYFSNLIYDKADMIVPALVLNVLRYPVAQISHVYNILNLIWILPKRREIYEWFKVFLPFLNTSTPIIMTAFLLMLTVMKLVIRFLRIKDNSRNAISFKLFGIFINQNVSYISPTRAINSLYVFWIWFCMVVNIIYQGNLMEGLRKTILEPQITTLDEALRSVDGVGGTVPILEYYRNTSIEKMYVTIGLNHLHSYIRDIETGKRFLLAVDSYEIELYQRDVQILDQRVSSVPTCVYMRARWPAATEVSFVISHLFESGFYEKFRNDIFFNWLLLKNHSDATLKPLRFKTVESCFYLLNIMSVISTVVLIIEILWKRYLNHHTNELSATP